MFLWNIAVTSLAEVWIEILVDAKLRQTLVVTSLAEVWIEIIKSDYPYWITESLPLRKCGLKSALTYSG